MSDYQTRPNTGSMFLSKNKKSEKAPDFYGSISIDKDLLIELVKNRTSELIEIKLDAWKKVTKNGDPWLSMSVNTYKKQEQQTEEKDPWL
jgi:hypothetical protein